ncbi:MAG: hypothetical protein M1409_08500 [Actinobacteria bacterium]|nr:hypothetical protein [Actinomycetota bacterium]
MAQRDICYYYTMYRIIRGMMKNEEIIETLLPWNLWEKDIYIGITRDKYLKKI